MKATMTEKTMTSPPNDIADVLSQEWIEAQLIESECGDSWNASTQLMRASLLNLLTPWLASREQVIRQQCGAGTMYSAEQIEDMAQSLSESAGFERWDNAAVMLRAMAYRVVEAEQREQAIRAEGLMEAERSLATAELREKLLSEQDTRILDAETALAALRERVTELESGLAVILKAVRGDEKSECWTIRGWLDLRDVFNDDMESAPRLVEAVCNALLPDPRASTPTQEQA